MSPVTGIGPRCRRCHQRPLWEDGLCSPCWRLVAAFGPGPGPVPLGEEGAEDTLEILDSSSAEFERRLSAWLSGADASAA